MPATDDATAPLPLDQGRAESKARPPGNAADDGKSGGRSQGGVPGSTQFKARNNNPRPANDPQRGAPAGDETDRSAPGAATHKQADDMS